MPRERIPRWPPTREVSAGRCRHADAQMMPRARISGRVAAPSARADGFGIITNSVSGIFSTSRRSKIYRLEHENASFQYKSRRRLYRESPRKARKPTSMKSPRRGCEPAPHVSHDNAAFNTLSQRRPYHRRAHHNTEDAAILHQCWL